MINRYSCNSGSPSFKSFRTKASLVFPSLIIDDREYKSRHPAIDETASDRIIVRNERKLDLNFGVGRKKINI